MAPTPRPAGWKGGSEDFGFIRTLDGHIEPDRYGTDNDLRFGNANVKHGFEAADLGGDYDDCDEVPNAFYDGQEIEGSA